MNHAVIAATGSLSTSRPTNQQHNTNNNNNMQPASFLLVTLLTMSVGVSFVPINLYFTYQSVAPDLMTSGLYDVGLMLNYIQSIMDPVYFTVSLSGIRQALWETFRHRR